MPTLPTVEPRGIDVGVPKYPAGAGVQGLEKIFGVLGGIAEESQKQQDQLDLANLHGEYQAKLGQAALDTKNELDYGKRDALFTQNGLKLQSEMLNRAGNLRVKRALQNEMARSFPEQALQFKIGNQKEWGLARHAELERQGELISDAIARSDGVREVENYKGMHESLLRGASQGPAAYLNPLEAEKERASMLVKAQVKRGRRLISNSGHAFFAADDAGEFKDIPVDTAIRLRAEARAAIAQDQRRADKVVSQVRDVAERSLFAAADRGELKDSDFLALGENPFITPQVLRTLRGVNDNPSSSEGSDSVGAIMSGYRLADTDRTPALIRKTKIELATLQRRLGRANPRITAAAKELDSDLLRFQEIDVQKENRAIRDLKTEYDAWVTASPIVQKILGNRLEADKAKIADAFRKGGAVEARRVLDNLIAGTKPKVDSVREKHGPALEWNPDAPSDATPTTPTTPTTPRR